MSAFLPGNRKDLAASATAHLPAFAAAGDDAGITGTQVTALTAARDALVALNTTAANDIEASQLSTKAANDGATRVRRAMVAISRQVSATALLDPDPDSVYAAAGLLPPARPTPAPDPAVPAGVTATLRTDGSVDVKWTATTASTVFNVERRLMSVGGEMAGWAPVPFAGRQPFVDATVPAGVAEVNYRVQSNRAGVLSPWSEPASLRFGAGGTQAPALKIAA